jgi:hypothetical protein
MKQPLKPTGTNRYWLKTASTVSLQMNSLFSQIGCSQAVGGIQLQVFEDDVEKAKQVLRGL